MALPITAIYAGLLGLLAIVLGASSGFSRAKNKVSIGDGGNPDQIVLVRRHGNFAEWVPIALILIAILELNDVSSAAIHAFGATLVVARILHPIGIKTPTRSTLPRTLGAMATALLVLITSIWAIYTGLS